MARDRGGRDGKPKPEMIREVLQDAPGMPARQVQSAVWERFGGEVTTREIAQVRRKLREAGAGPAAPEPRPVEKAMPSTARADRDPEAAEKPARKPAKSPEAAAAPVRRKRAAGVRARDFAGADVTVQQLSAILEVADKVGGLRRLQEALQTVMLLREKVGDVDEGQLASALDFLGRLTGAKR